MACMTYNNYFYGTGFERDLGVGAVVSFRLSVTNIMVILCAKTTAFGFFF